MTRTEERLVDALDAAARVVREDTLRPLLAPERQRHRFAMVTPLAAAAALLLVVGLGVAVARYLPGPGSAVAQPRYYVEASHSDDLPQVRSTATGAVTDTVRVPHVHSSTTPSVVAAAANGVFFAAVAQSAGEKVYRFRLTASGRVSNLAQVPGGAFGNPQWGVGAMAASPDGSQLAVALTPTTTVTCGSSGPCSSTDSNQNGYIDVVNTSTGARSVFQGGIGPSFTFSAISLSWTSDGNELVYYGQWCPQATGNSIIACAPGTPTGGQREEVWALTMPSRGGTLTSGHRLLQVPALYDIPQAEISPDGQTITAVAVTSPARGSANPTELAVEQLSIPTGKPLRVLYRQDLHHAFGRAKSGGYLAFVGLSLDGTARYWMLSDAACSAASASCSGGVNGWINNRQLVPLQPGGASVSSEAW